MVLHVQFKFPKASSPQSIRAKLLNVVKWANDEEIRLINQYLWTWEHRDQIQIKPDYGYKGGDAYANIYIDDSTGAFWYVEHGTKSRYATMTPDFVAKTSPRRIQSGRGRGGKAYVNRQRRRKGIQGRHVLDEIAKIVKPGVEMKIMRILSDIRIGIP